MAWGRPLDTGSKPSVVYDWYRFPNFNKLFTEHSSKIFKELRCNSVLKILDPERWQQFPFQSAYLQHLQFWLWSHWTCMELCSGYETWLSYQMSLWSTVVSKVWQHSSQILHCIEPLEAGSHSCSQCQQLIETWRKDEKGSAKSIRKLEVLTWHFKKYFLKLPPDTSKLAWVREVMTPMHGEIFTF